MDQAIIGSNRKIDPNRRAHLKADLTPDDNDRVEIGPTAMAFAEWQSADVPNSWRRYSYRGARARMRGTYLQIGPQPFVSTYLRTDTIFEICFLSNCKRR